ncbi:MAG TPA: glycosyltransferase family 2 protein [Chthoniobacterales bacterium]|jgi:dolichol-phosphate mannosyltransferase|nr:glycosyltransferase family 2 protein [Chthoniobacterales bacterium]
MDSSPQQFMAPELAVVMPIYNEAANIGSVLEEWFACLDCVAPDFVFFAINDGSKDDTAVVLSSLGTLLGPRLRVVNKPNSGHGRSCRKGYDLALATGARWVFQIDSDGQCDPAFFETIYSERKGHDCVFGYRRTRDDGFGRLVITRSYRVLLWALTGAFMRDANVPYRLIRTNPLRLALRCVPADVDLQNIALTISLTRQPDVHWKDVPIHFRARQGGENSINYHKIAKMGARFLRDFQRISHEDSHPWWRPRWAWRRLAS